MESLPFSHWQATCSRAALQQRAALYAQIRQFFNQREVLEVETAILSQCCIPESNIYHFQTAYHQLHSGQVPQVTPLYLRTSPEAQMKRLLASGSGAIFQIAKVFRDEEAGRWHQPEFTMLEWYRPDFTIDAFLQEVDDLLQLLLGCAAAERLSYCEAFAQFTPVHPLDSSLSELQKYADTLGFSDAHRLNQDECLQFIMVQVIEPQIGRQRPVILTDFPAAQAALARKKTDNPLLAERFEVYFQGLELANGFHELADAIEQRQRFIEQLETRQQQNLPTPPLDERLLNALAAGLPDCCGIAIGLDRILMLQIQARSIEDVVAFTVRNS